MTSGFAILFLTSALMLIGVGSFLPYWARVLNSTTEGNVSYSLWKRRECFGLICSTEHTPIQWRNEECWFNRKIGRQECKETTGTRIRSDTTCRVANYCNSSWITVSGERAIIT